MSEQIKVRIAVAVDPSGDWSCAGIYGDMTLDDAFSCCIDTVDPGERRYVLTADLDIPWAVEVEPRVEEIAAPPEAP